MLSTLLRGAHRAPGISPLANPRLSPHPQSMAARGVAGTAKDYVLERDDYCCRLGDSSTQRKVRMLIERMYAWRGYRTDTIVERPPAPHRIPLIASRGDQLFGTLTLGLDSSEGLLADELYRNEINAFRTRNRKVCELSKLAVDPQYSSKEVLASLFHLAYFYGRTIYKATDVFIEVNPRHTGFYKRLLGFRQIGEMRSCPRVNAPAVLLHQEMEHVEARLSHFGGKGGVRAASTQSHTHYNLLHLDSLALSPS